ncbi:hypothetical protein FHS89_002264 [Rubricella aquisinus]|uniref:Hedgehog/Intein (Hint) domain-containing protein n=1 Tax=Rubricella aquisinus TaxID=2028108 RepID=A0A840WMD1_9RHOB|nr:Hint domain-containing protein [Rubricella aquisinus]MBB5516238.1 hypothetical protein [Rubricella aquisinus]
MTTTYTLFAYSADAFGYNASTNSFEFFNGYDPFQDRVRMEITDNDVFFDGDASADERGEDTNQTGIVTRPDGTAVASGRIYVEAYAEIRAPGGRILTIDRVEIGGQLIGYLPSEQLDPNLSYEFIRSFNVDNNDPDFGDTTLRYTDYIDLPCFAPDTRIATPAGERVVADLRAGDLVLTRDHGPRPIRWWSRHQVGLDGDTLPVLIRMGAFGPAIPRRDLILSAQHRVLVGGTHQLPYESERFAPAKGLVRQPGIRLMRGRHHQDWVHFALDRHEIVFAEGCEVESLLIGPMVIRNLPARTRLRLYGLFPRRTGAQALNGRPARPCLTVQQALRLPRAMDSLRQPA